MPMLHLVRLFYTTHKSWLREQAVKVVLMREKERERETERERERERERETQPNDSSKIIIFCCNNLNDKNLNELGLLTDNGYCGQQHARKN